MAKLSVLPSLWSRTCLETFNRQQMSHIVEYNDESVRSPSSVTGDFYKMQQVLKGAPQTFGAPSELGPMVESAGQLNGRPMD